jgi:polyhydroxyalkanoate synthase subunit PhaE
MTNESDSAAFTTAWQTLMQNMGVRLPALGLAREHLDMAQRMSELGAQFQRSYAEFTAHLSGIQQEAMQTLQKPGIGTAYDEWIESAEAAYATLAHGPTFARLLAELINTQSAMKVQRGKLLEYFSRQFDLPTRSEVDSLHRQLRVLREQVRERSGSKQSGSKQSGIKQSGIKQSGIKRSGAKRRVTKSSGSKRSGSKQRSAERSGK